MWLVSPQRHAQKERLGFRVSPLGQIQQGQIAYGGCGVGMAGRQNLLKNGHAAQI